MLLKKITVSVMLWCVVRFVMRQCVSLHFVQPPFIMDRWCHGTVADMTIECVVTYEVCATVSGLQLATKRLTGRGYSKPQIAWLVRVTATKNLSGQSYS
jgi:hypothetical protein